MIENLEYHNYKKEINDWTFSSKNFEIVVFHENNMGHCIIMDGMKVAAKIIVADNMVRFSTSEGYAVQIDIGEKTVTVFKEKNT